MSAILWGIEHQFSSAATQVRPVTESSPQSQAHPSAPAADGLLLGTTRARSALHVDGSDGCSSSQQGGSPVNGAAAGTNVKKRSGCSRPGS